MTGIILTSLEKALHSLHRALQQEKNEFIRDAVVQRFEYTFELCWKMLRRQLIEELGSESVNGLSRKDLFRISAEQGLISDPVHWFAFHKARNETSHTYNEEVAEEVYRVAETFLPEADALYSILRERNA